MPYTELQSAQGSVIFKIKKCEVELILSLSEQESIVVGDSAAAADALPPSSAAAADVLSPVAAIVPTSALELWGPAQALLHNKMSDTAPCDDGATSAGISIVVDRYQSNRTLAAIRSSAEDRPVREIPGSGPGRVLQDRPEPRDRSRGPRDSPPETLPPGICRQ